MNMLCAVCGIIALVSDATSADLPTTMADPPKTVVSLFGGKQTITVDEAKAAIEIVGATLVKLESDVTEIYAKQGEAVSRYERIRRQIERLQAMLVEINNEIVVLDQQRFPLEAASQDAKQSQIWLEEAVKDAEADQVADIPLNATAYLEYVERLEGGK